jgi:hypothetical protein
VIALGHGGFLPWIDREFGMSDQTAHRFIHVANMAGQIPQIVEFQPSVLYALAAPSTPEEVRTVVAEKAADPCQNALGEFRCRGKWPSSRSLTLVWPPQYKRIIRLYEPTGAAARLSMVIESEDLIGGGAPCDVMNMLSHARRSLPRRNPSSQ